MLGLRVCGSGKGPVWGGCRGFVVGLFCLTACRGVTDRGDGVTGGGGGKGGGSLCVLVITWLLF